MTKKIIDFSAYFFKIIDSRHFIFTYLSCPSPQNRLLNLYYARLLKKSKPSETFEDILEPKWIKLSRKYHGIWKICTQYWSAILNSKLLAKPPTLTRNTKFETFYLRHI